MNKINFLLLSVFATVIFNSCQERNQKSPNAITIGNNKPDCLQSHLHDSIRAGDDFFEYANGGWIKKNPIPNSESQWGIFNLVDDENKKRIRKISEDATAIDAPKGSNMQLIGDFFSAGMDSIGVEKNGITALIGLLANIDSIQNTNDILKSIAGLQKVGVGVAYNLSIYADLKNSAKNLLYFSQGGLGLQNRDYYFNTDAQTTKIRAAYPLTIAKIFTLSGIAPNTASSMANAVVVLETKLAKGQRKLEALRDPEKNYNKIAMSTMPSISGNINLIDHFKQLNIHTDSLCVGQPEYIKTLMQELNTTGIADWKAYLKWHLINNYAVYLNSAIDKENFNFYGSTMQGIKEQRPRWKRVLDEQEDVLGDALGQLYVKEYFSEKVKNRYVDLTEKIVATYREHIQKLDWMGDSTKQKAILKLNSIIKKVGYPDKWKDYSKMKITRDNYCQNILNSRNWHYEYELAKLDKPVDRLEWGMTPQTYNAYYNPSNNEIVLPASMFIAPGYADDELDDALVYGYVGASTIGHELTHGFDDEGRKFDEKGNLKNWWTAADEKNFNDRAKKLVAQFNAYTVLGNKHPNGEATLGENIADLGGIVIGYDAFTKTKQFKENKLIGGLTPAQRFFLGYAYGWMQVRTKEKLANQLLTDVHAPIFLRVNGPMSNCDAWYTAFNVNKGMPMFRDSVDRVRIW